MKTEPAVLGLDLGTSQIKALLCNSNGDVLGEGIAGYSVRTPKAGWAEIDPEEWWRACAVAVRAAVEPACGEVEGLAIVGQMHGAVLVDERGSTLRPAIVWLDHRSSDEVADYLRLSAELRSVLGNPPSPGMAGPTLLWLSRHEPEVYRHTRWLLQPKDWLRFRMTGIAATEPTDASGTLLYDLPRCNWATRVLEAMGLRTDVLPQLRTPAEVAGSLTPEAAEYLGLPAGLPVAVGAADTAASMLAAALPADGWCMLTLGTGGQWVVPIPAGNYDALAVDPSGQTNLFCAVDGGYYRLAAAQNVGIALGWVTNTLATAWEDLYATAARPWTPGLPVFLPFLAGERWDQAAHSPYGAWEDLSLPHQREDLMRAAIEGVAFLLRARLEDLRATGCRPERALFAGGGSRHLSWRRMLGDVLQLPLSPAGTAWLSARGATLIAGVATGMYGTWDEAARSVPPPEPAPEVIPNPLAEEKYLRFRCMWDRARS